MINKKLVIKVENILPEWCKIFNETSILNLKLCNQPLIDYYLHFARHLGVKEVIICHPEYDKKIWKYEGNNYFSFKIKCEISPQGESLQKFKNRNLNLISDHNVICITQAVFIYFDLTNQKMVEFFKEKRDYEISGKIQPNIVTKRIDSINDYFNLSMSIIDRYHHNYFFREFSIKQNGVFFGRGVEIKNLHSVKESCLIGSYSVVDKSSFLKRRCVIADFSVVGPGSEIENTIFYDPVRLRANSRFKNKIVIDGIIYDCNGKALSKGNSIESEKGPIKERVLGRLAALVLLFIISIPSAFLEILFSGAQKERDLYYDNEGHPFFLRRLKNKGALADYYQVLNFSILQGLLGVITKNLQLVGHDDFLSIGKRREFLFDCNNLVMDQDFRIGGDLFVKFYHHKKSFFYDIIIIVRFYLSKTMQIIR